MKTVKKVRLIIFNDAKLLLLRKEYKKNFTFAGGTVKKTETLKDALIREVHEEIGALISKMDVTYIAGFATSKNNIRCLNHYYLLNCPERFKYELLEPEKFKELNWINAIKATKNLKFYEKFLIDEVVLCDHFKAVNCLK